MCHFKEIETGCKHSLFINCFFFVGGTEPYFRANLLFGYAQSDYERTFFSGSTVRLFKSVDLLIKSSVQRS